MSRTRNLLLSATLALFALSLTGRDARAQEMAPPGGGFKKVSSLVSLPDFIPGLGTLYVDPATLPAGPFLAYDRDGNLVSTIYMIPLKDLNAHKAFDALATSNQKVDHVDIVFNAGHPGVDEPHYHIILWHVSRQKAAALQSED